MSRPDVPDVTVITPVHNSAPYLARWWSSLLGQTLGPERVEVLAVDDGSTDGSRQLLDSWAELHPDLLRVSGFPDRGGPARARNRALDLARGRYLYFVDSDDYLGPEALARTVAMADELEADIVLGRMAGVGGRAVHRPIYARTETDLPFPHPLLVRSLNVTKLYRRELVARYRLRFPEQLPVYSDQPFALEAYVRSGRTAVLADYDCYFLTRRPDRGNLTLVGDQEDRLRAAEVITAKAAELLPAGAGRNQLLQRSFEWEIGPVVGTVLLDAPERIRRRLLGGVRRQVEHHLAPELEAALPPELRRRLRLVRERRDGELLALLREQRAAGRVPVPVRTESVAWSADRRGVPRLRVGLTGLDGCAVRAFAVRGDGLRLEMDVRPDGSVQLPLSALIPRQRAPRGRWTLELDARLGAARATPEVPALPLRPRRWWYRGRPYRVTPMATRTGSLQLAVAPIRPTRVLSLRARRLLGTR